MSDISLDGTRARLGLYGKVPWRGDFVRSGLSDDFIEPWGTWLHSILALGRTRYGTFWQNIYSEAPVWRFALPPGSAGRKSVSGVIIPSADSVGRLFPFTIAAQLSKTNAWDALIALANIHETLEAVAQDFVDQNKDDGDEILDNIVTHEFSLHDLPTMTQYGSSVVMSGDPIVSMAQGWFLQNRPNASIWLSECDTGQRALLADGLPLNDQDKLALFAIQSETWENDDPDHKLDNETQS